MKFHPTHFIKRTMVPVQIIGYDKGTLIQVMDEKERDCWVEWKDVVSNGRRVIPA
tara:strand:+ start:564 stop:728 length:165 start_codon:yes stop_codon:yes gene_type:complete